MNTDNENKEQYADLIRFLCETWSDINKWAYENCTVDQLMKYPVVQGTRNQINLKRIGQQNYEPKNIRLAVEDLLRCKVD